MSTTSVEKAVVVEVSVPAIREGYAILNIMKVWGSLEVHHRGNTLQGGMTWEPDGKLPVGIAVSDEIINPQQVAVLFSDLIGTLMPSIRVLVNAVDGDEEF